MSDRKISIGIVVITAVVAGIGLYYHEWWRDEARTWLILHNSHSLPQLIRHLGFDGHPKFYYILNYALFQLLPTPSALSALNLFFAVAAIGFFVASAPFTRLQKLLFAVGFFPLYQYGIIVRSYSLFVALLFAYCYFKTRHPRMMAMRAVILSLLAQTHLMAMAIVPVLVGMEWWQDFRAHRNWNVREWFWSGVVALSLGFAAWQILPPGGDHPLHIFGNPAYALLGLGHAFWPDFGVFLRWRPFEIIGIGLWVLSWRIFKGRRPGLWYYMLLTAILFGISVVIYSGHRWHHGIYFICFIIAVWLSAEKPYTDIFSRYFITGILLLHALIGGYAIVDDFLRPYSNGDAVARWIRRHDLERYPMVGIEVFRGKHHNTVYKWEIDQIQPVMMALGGKEIYDPMATATATSWHHYDDVDYFPRWDGKTMQDELDKAAGHLPRPFLVIVAQGRGLSEFSPPFPLHFLAGFPTPSDYGEHLSIYIYPSP